LYGSARAGKSWQLTGEGQTRREERQTATNCDYGFLPMPRREEKAYARWRDATGGAAIILDESVRESSRSLRQHGCCMSAAHSRSLRSDSYVRMQHCVRRSTYIPFRWFWGIFGENLRVVFLLLFMVLWLPIFATLYRRAVLMLWHAFLFLRLRPVGIFPPFSFLLGGSFHCLFL
jgi:hypothetical protein